MQNKKSKIQSLLKKISEQTLKQVKQPTPQITSSYRIKSMKKMPKHSPLKITFNKYDYLKKKDKKNSNQKYIANKTNFGTSNQKSTILSYLSTPNQNSLIKKNKLKKIKSLNSLFFKTKQIYQSTSDQNISQEYIKIEYYFLNKKIGSKKFFSFESVQQIKNYLIDLLKNEEKIINYYGMIGLNPIPYNHGLYHLLNMKQTLIITLLAKKYLQISIEPILLTEALNYKNLSLKNFTILKYLGNGGFSNVYLGRCKIDQKICALKLIKKSTIMNIKKIKIFQNQKNILFNINHPNLINLLYAFESYNYIVFVIQYCQNGNLFNFLSQHKTINQDDVKYMCWEIVNGLEYLHQNSILFRDLKLQNILFDVNGKIKITDFGLSKPELSEADVTYSYCGSPEYMAPEMLAKCGHSFNVDYYALGILLYELLYGKSPFYSSKKEDIFQLILHSEPKFPKQPNISKEGKDLIKGLLVKNPNYRIGSLKGIKQIKCHPWMRSFREGDRQNREIFNFVYKNLCLSAKQEKEIKEYFKVDYEQENYKKYFLPDSFVSQKIYDFGKRNTVVFLHKTKGRQKLVKNSKTLGNHAK